MAVPYELNNELNNYFNYFNKFFANYFNEYMKLRKTHRLGEDTSQFLDLIYRMVFELFVYCVTVQAKNRLGHIQCIRIHHCNLRLK